MRLALSIPKVHCFCTAHLSAKEEVPCVKNLVTLLFVSVLAFPASGLFVQAAPAQEKIGEMGKREKKAKQDPWEGVVIRSSPDKSTLTVRKQQEGQRH
jgi:hypothetical protein